MIGSEIFVKNRRLSARISNFIGDICRECPHYHLDSGSRAEGFRFESSDHDMMIVHKEILILMDDITVFPDNNFIDHTMQNVLLMETDQTRPGFCLLRVFGSWNIKLIYLSRVPYHNGHYVSSALWRTAVHKYIPESIEHGPCESGSIYGGDYDIAHCLELKQWPKSAHSCMKRLALTYDVSTDVLTKIVGKGCHLVAIGDKASEKELLEWRISFSEAEKMLIHNMNHCQFLCYGLLKMFLTEVINTKTEIHGLLCSYFLKTAVFWEISCSNASWAKADFLKRFWDCFRRLISWVKHGYCPNFFIPENNMFIGKIYGRTQKVLLRYLAALYYQGYRCIPICHCNRCTVLLSCPFLGLLEPCGHNQIEKKVLENFSLIGDIYSSIAIVDEKCKFKLNAVLELLQKECRHESVTFLTIIDVLQKCNTQRLLSCSMLNYGPLIRSTSNKKRYYSIIAFLKAMNQNKYDVCNHKFLSAVTLYNFGMYQHVIRIMTAIGNRMKLKKMLYLQRGVHSSEYEELGGKFKNYDVMMREFFADDISLENELTVPELIYEHQNPWQTAIVYPPFVLMNLLLFLSCFRLTLFDKAEHVLHDLTSLLKNESDYHISPSKRAISWQVLGICQEMSGYIYEACMSYKKCLADPNGNYFRETTRARIMNIERLHNEFIRN